MTDLNWRQYPNQSVEMNKRQALQFIKSLGYEVEPDMTCFGNNVEGPYQSFGLREIDTKVSAWHYKDARRDSKFYQLQNFRFFTICKNANGLTLEF